MAADELGPWPSARFVALYERGRSIMAEDLDCWPADLLRAFGFPERPNAELTGAEPSGEASGWTTGWAAD